MSEEFPDIFTLKPMVKDMLKIDWIEGITLRRYYILHRKNNQAIILVRQPSYDDQRMSCDGCVRKHSPIKVSCSRNHEGQRTWATLPLIYNFETRQPIESGWKQKDFFWPKASIGVELWHKQ